MDVAKTLNSQNIITRVVSLMSWELFDEQLDEYKAAVLGDASLNVSIEAQSSFGWERFIGQKGCAIAVDTFGKSGNYSDIKSHFGFDELAIVNKVKQKLNSLAVMK